MENKCKHGYVRCIECANERNSPDRSVSLVWTYEKIREHERQVDFAYKRSICLNYQYG